MDEQFRGNASAYDNLNMRRIPLYYRRNAKLLLYFPHKPFSLNVISSRVTTNASYVTGTMHAENRLRPPSKLHDLAQFRETGNERSR
jgi:hypothetical protein